MNSKHFKSILNSERIKFDKKKFKNQEKGVQILQQYTYAYIKWNNIFHIRFYAICSAEILKHIYICIHIYIYIQRIYMENPMHRSMGTWSKIVGTESLDDFFKNFEFKKNRKTKKN